MPRCPPPPPRSAAYVAKWSNIWHLKLNPQKCSVITFTLRTVPIGFGYSIGGEKLARNEQIRDLGVILDSRLAFGPHVDAAMAKANKMLGLLLRRMQLAHRRCHVKFERKANIAAYNAHVRSVIEYACVTWSGAAKTHLARFERLQHRFLMWLAASTESRCPSLAYEELLDHFMVPSIKSRFIRTGLFFLHKILRNSIDSTHLVGQFGIAAPGRRLRHTGVLNVPFARVNLLLKHLFSSACQNYTTIWAVKTTLLIFFIPAVQLRRHIGIFS